MVQARRKRKKKKKKKETIWFEMWGWNVLWIEYTAVEQKKVQQEKKNVVRFDTCQASLLEFITCKGGIYCEMG